MNRSLERLKLILMASAGQKRWMLWVLKFGSLLVVFLVFLYPVYRESDNISTNRFSLKDQIDGLKKISTNLLTPEELDNTDKRLKLFESKLVFASKAAGLLDFVSNEADKNHFNVIQIYSDSPATLKDEQSRELVFHGKKLMLLPVNFRVEADYKSFGNFLKAMKDDTPAEFVVELMSLKKTSPDSESLQCDMTVSFVVV